MKREKPKNYGFYFLKHGIIVFTIWAIVLIAVSLWVERTMAARFEKKASEDYFSFKTDVMQCVKEDAMENKEASLIAFLPNYYRPFFDELEYQSLAYVIDNETGKTVGLTDKCNDEVEVIFVFDRGMDQPRQGISGELVGVYDRGYYCDKATLKEYMGDLEDRLLDWKKKKGEPEDQHIKRNYEIKLESFYYKDSYFLPGKVTVTYKEINARGIVREEEVLEVVSFEPENPSDYHFKEIDPEKEFVYGDLSKVYTEDPLQREKWQEFLYRARSLDAQMDHSLRNEYYDPYIIYKSDEKFMFVPKMQAIAREFLFSDVTGHVYKAVFYEECKTWNLLSFYDYDIIKFAFITLPIICFIVTFLTSEWEYRKKRYVYLTEGYRDFLVDSMAHDLKSPLMAISGYAENLKENLKENNLTKSSYYAEKIYDNAGYVNNLLMNNLNVLQRNSKLQKLVKTEINLKELFEEAFTRHGGEMEQRKLTLNVQGELRAKGDGEMLKKAADNLVTNCIRYAVEGSEIVLQFEKKTIILQNRTEVPLKGNLKKLWEPFVRGEESRGGKGTGLGFAIVANVLERHGWKYFLKYEKETQTFCCMIKVTK